MAYQGVWAVREQLGMLAIRCACDPILVEIGAGQDGKPYAEHRAHETDEPQYQARVECIWGRIRQNTASGRNLQCGYDKGEEAQPYCDLKPPHASATDTAHRGTGRQAPVHDENEPEREDQPAPDGCRAQAALNMT